MAQAVKILECNNCGFKETDQIDQTDESKKIEDDDFLICIKAGCNKQNIIFCRGCMRSSHKRKGDHALDKDPNNFINILEQKICSKCKMVDGKTKSNDHLFVCIKQECEYRDRIMCKECIAESHKNDNDHNPQNDTNSFVLLKEWYSLLRLRQIEPDGYTMAVSKVSVKSAYHGGAAVYAAYSVLDKVGKAALAEIPKNATSKQWAQGVIGAIKASETSMGVVMKSMAKSQAFINGLMFAAECGYYAFDYGYNGNGTYEQMIVKCQTAAKAHTSAFVCSMILGGIGFMIGGPWGASIGATLGGIVGDYGMRKYCNADDEKEFEKKAEKIKAALRTFDYPHQSLDALKDKDKFNLDELKRRYHLKAVWNHPDLLRNQDYTEEEIKEKWMKFYSKYIILLEVCKQRDNGK